MITINMIIHHPLSLEQIMFVATDFFIFLYKFVDKIVSSFVRSALRIFVVGMDQTSIVGKKC